MPWLKVGQEAGGHFRNVFYLMRPVLSRELFVQPAVSPLMAWPSTSHLRPSGSSKALSHCPSEGGQRRCDQGSATLKGPYGDQQPRDMTNGMHRPKLPRIHASPPTDNSEPLIGYRAFKERCTWANIDILKMNHIWGSISKAEVYCTFCLCIRMTAISRKYLMLLPNLHWTN